MKVNSFTSEITLGQKLWRLLPRSRRNEFLYVIILMLITSIAEAISISAVIPFLGVLTSPERVFNNNLLIPIFREFNISDPAKILLPITIIFCTLAILSGGLRLLLLRTNIRLSFEIGADISLDIYRKTLYQPYSIHITRNSSEIIDGISTKTNIATNYINAVLTCITSSVLLFSIILCLIFIQPYVALFTFITFGLFYSVTIKLVRSKIKINSEIISAHSTLTLKTLREGLGGIRDIIIGGSQEIFCSIYKSVDGPLRKASSNNQVVSAAPRFIMESLGIALIATLSYFLINQNNPTFDAVPILGGIALGAQRLMPALQQLYSSWITIKSSQASLTEVVKLLNQPLPGYLIKSISGEIPFINNFELINIGYKYPNATSYAIKNITLNIKKGARLGIVGASGRGKSTLLDIIMGLLNPTEGYLIVDGKKIIDQGNAHIWQKNIAHVPQSIYISDANVIENVAFGIPANKVDMERVHSSIEKSLLTEIIENLPNKYYSKLGEGGINLSGGQRQRIGIARALYKGAKIIILDEATSALDTSTESLIMQSISKIDKDITIILVSHRLSILGGFDEIIDLSNPKI